MMIIMIMMMTITKNLMLIIERDGENNLKDFRIRTYKCAMV